MVGKAIVLIFLMMGTVFDLKRKSVPNKYLYIWSVLTIVLVIIEIFKGKNVIDIILGVIPGIIFLFLAFVTREQIGSGDGWIIMLMGIFLGVNNVSKIIFVGFGILTLVSMTLLISRKAGKKTTIPFIPFLLMGFIACGISGELL